MYKKDGFSLIEVLAAITIVSIVAILTFTTFVKINRTQALDKTRATVISILESARASSMASRDASAFGVHIATTTITTFKGSMYVPNSATNVVFNVSSYVELASSTIKGGNDIVFGRLMGTTTNYGTVIYQLKSDHALQKSINVQATGIID